MERTTKHRILGILVVVGLVIILLPFFQSAKEGQTQDQAALIKAPPFPDQPVQVAANTNTESADQTLSATDQPSVQNVTPPTPPQTSTQSSDNDMNQAPDDTITMNHPSVINQTIPDMTNPNSSIMNTHPKSNAAKSKRVKLAELPAATTPDAKAQTLDAVVKQTVPDDASSDSAEVKNTVEMDVAPVQKAKSTIKKVLHARKEIHPNSKVKPVLAMKSPLDNDGLFKLKTAVYVVQLGSFKNKTNALRLVNQLRASGYRAFIQEIASNTRVFIGPETKQTTARALASQIESQMHLRGIVISYQPLTL